MPRAYTVTPLLCCNLAGLALGLAILEAINLEYYLKLGAKVTKIHRILTFDEKPFLKEYIDLNTELRKKSKNDLEKDLFKLMNNTIFGKSMENVLNRSNIKLINNNPEKLLKLIKQPNFQNAY